MQVLVTAQSRSLRRTVFLVYHL